MKVKDIIKWAIQNEDIDILCKYYFKTLPTGGQKEIIKSIAFKKHKRIVISAYTRYGKSWAVAQGVLLYIRFNPNKRVRLIAPTGDQANILRNYITEFILHNNEFVALLTITGSKEERLRNEVNKSRITFRNGTDLKVLSAQGKAERLMGWGGDLIIFDESCLTSYEVYRQKISRMLGDNPNSILIEIGNPWHRNNQMWEHWTDPKFKKIHIDWKQGLKEGRITKEFVEEQRRLLTDIEFTILYEAMFPEDSDDTLIKWKWIDDAVNRKFSIDLSSTKKYIIYGLDVAEMGRDLTILIKTIVYPEYNLREVKEIWSWGKKSTMETVGKVRQRISENDAIINVDAIGVGSGVYSRLAELGYNAVPIKVSENSKDKRFFNKKAELYWRLRSAFEEGLISIPDDNRLIEQLRKMTYKITSGGKIQIIDPEDKSPDYADALMDTMAFIPATISGVRIFG